MHCETVVSMRTLRWMDLLIGSTESASQFKAEADSREVAMDGRPVEVVVAVTGWSSIADQCCQSSIVPNDVGPHSIIGQPEEAGFFDLCGRLVVVGIVDVTAYVIANVNDDVLGWRGAFHLDHKQPDGVALWILLFNIVVIPRKTRVVDPDI